MLPSRFIENRTKAQIDSKYPSNPAGNGDSFHDTMKFRIVSIKYIVDFGHKKPQYNKAYT